MVQIIQAQPTTQTLRQQAFQQGLDQIGQGVLGFANVMDQRTQREQALNEKKNQNALELIKARISAGEELTPQEEAFVNSNMPQQLVAQSPQAIQSEQPTSEDVQGAIGKLFAQQAQSAANPEVKYDEAGNIMTPASVKPQFATQEATQMSPQQTYQGRKLTPRKQAEVQAKLIDQKIKQAQYEDLYDENGNRKPFAQTSAAEELKFKKELDSKYKTDKDKELSVQQQKQKGLFEMGLLANKQYEEAIDKGAKDNSFDPTSYKQVLNNSYIAPQYVKADAANEAASAQSSWVEAFLRDASGATIHPSERMYYAADFFPRPGDTPTQVENKRALREQKMKNALIASGDKDLAYIPKYGQDNKKPGDATDKQQLPPPAKGMTHIKDPQGNIIEVPENQVNELISKGAQRI